MKSTHSTGLGAIQFISALLLVALSGHSAPSTRAVATKPRAAEATRAAQCAFCRSITHAPTAFLVTRGNAHMYACCIMCAMAAALRAGDQAVVTLPYLSSQGIPIGARHDAQWIWDHGSFQIAIMVKPVSVSHRPAISFAPAGIAIWHVTYPEKDKRAVRSWHIFPDKPSLERWRRAHPEAKGQIMPLAALQTRAQMEAVRAMASEWCSRRTLAHEPSRRPRARQTIKAASHVMRAASAS